MIKMSQLEMKVRNHFAKESQQAKTPTPPPLTTSEKVRQAAPQVDVGRGPTPAETAAQVARLRKSMAARQAN